MLSRLERKSQRLERTLKEFEFQLKWLAVWLFLSAFRKGSARKTRPLDPRQVRRVLFLRHDKIGDMVLTLSTYHTLKRFFPHIEIGVLASKSNAIIIQNDASVSFVHIHDKSARGLLTTFRSLRRQHYDVVVDLMKGASVTSLILAMAAAPGSYRIGIDKEAFVKYYDYYSQVWRNDAIKLHITEIFRATLLPFGIPLAAGVTHGRIQLSPAQQERGRQIAGKIREGRYERVVFLNASAGKLDRTWAEEKFIRSVGVLSRSYPHVRFVVSYAPEDIRLARNAAAAGSANVSMIPDGMSIIDIIALLPHVDLVISVDTSICHIAAEIDVPLIALYSGDEANFSRWRPFGERVWAVRSPDPKAVDGISVEQLVEVVERVLREQFEVSPVAVAV
jgi:ADP-heptose:LPS heptosyltransferase